MRPRRILAPPGCVPRCRSSFRIRSRRCRTTNLAATAARSRAASAPSTFPGTPRAHSRWRCSARSPLAHRRAAAPHREFEARAQKRYDDTDLVVGEIVEHGFDSERGVRAIARMNAIHARFAIANEDMLYVLSTFVFEPIRWNARWRHARSCAPRMPRCARGRDCCACCRAGSGRARAPRSRAATIRMAIASRGSGRRRSACRRRPIAMSLAPVRADHRRATARHEAVMDDFDAGPRMTRWPRHRPKKSS